MTRISVVLRLQKPLYGRIAGRLWRMPPASPDLPPPSQETFRDVLAMFPAGVNVLSTSVDGQPYATTATAFSSVSLDPMLVMVALGRDSRLLERVRQTQRLGISYLHGDQRETATLLARRTKDCAQVPWEEIDGLPAVRDARAFLGTRVTEFVSAGDHDVLLCAVETAQKHGQAAPPLLYHEREFHTL
jgi:flavin reductase (DIM6/NTAB) family NADH-FMN oxidoreductase RutF